MVLTLKNVQILLYTIILFIFFYLVYENNQIRLKKKHLRESFENGNLLPLSGSEPNYDPDKWNDDANIRKSHNCYAYFLDDINPELKNICKNGTCNYINPQPGHHCGMTCRVNKSETTCDKMDTRILCDNPDIKISSDSEQCPVGYYKGALTVNPNKQYHFYRQDSNQYWSHKDGGKPVTKYDASNNLIVNPKTADRDYKGTSNYKKLCNFYCIPSNSHLPTKYARTQSCNKTLYKS